MGDLSAILGHFFPMENLITS